VQAACDLGREIPRDLKIVTRYDGLRARESLPQLTAAVNLHTARTDPAAIVRPWMACPDRGRIQPGESRVRRRGFYCDLPIEPRTIGQLIPVSPRGSVMILLLIGILITIIVGAICFWAIDKFVRDGRLANLLKLLVVLICLASILQRVLPMAGISSF
jgi:hypothetical protein